MFETTSLAEQCRQLAAAAQKRIEEEKKLESANPALHKKVGKLYAKILKAIQKESKEGGTTLFWSNAVWFGKWTVSLTVASALCDLLKKDGFESHPVLSIFDKEQYYVSINWTGRK